MGRGDPVHNSISKELYLVVAVAPNVSAFFQDITKSKGKYY